MKKILLSILSLSLACQMQAQSIVNGSFEAWVPVSGGLSWERPEGWYGTDKMLSDLSTILALAGYSLTAENQLKKSTTAYEGDFAARIMSLDLGESFGVTPCLMVNGVPSLDVVSMGEALAGGDVDLASILTVTGGTPLLGRRADSVVAYVHTPEYNLDTAAIFVQAKQISGDSMITIGAGAAFIEPDLEYTRLSIPIEYLDESNTIADTLIIMAVSSAGIPSGEDDAIFGATLENSLYIDDMALFTSDVSSILPTARVHLGVSVFPNPASSSIQWNNTFGKELLLQIYDLNGRVMHHITLPEGRSAINLQQYPVGSYFYQVVDPSSNERQTGTFMKK